jgi:predicted phage terminase large subunit-like protein
LIRDDSWRTWEKYDKTGNLVFPALDLVVASLDGAFTDKTLNDPSAITVWGRFNLPEVREPQFILLHAWQGRLIFNELVEHATRICLGDWRGSGDDPIPDGGTKVDVLLIENKACGASVGQEIVRRQRRRKWRTLMINPRGDKTSRLISVQPLFSGGRRPDGRIAPGQIWAPDRDWAQMVIDQVTNFPRAGHDDLTDTVSQALKFLRDQGAAMSQEEAEEDWEQRNRYHKPPRPLYPCAGGVRA